MTDLREQTLEQLKQLALADLFNIEAQRQLFALACQNNLLERAQRIYSLGNIIMNHNIFYIVKKYYACHLEIIQWIYSLNFHPSPGMIIQAACYNSNLDIVKWICSQHKFNIHRMQDHVYFKVTYDYEYLEIMQWLLELNVFKNFNGINSEWIAAMLEHNPENIKHISNEYLPEHIRHKRFMSTKSANHLMRANHLNSSAHVHHIIVPTISNTNDMSSQRCLHNSQYALVCPSETPTEPTTATLKREILTKENINYWLQY